MMVVAVGCEDVGGGVRLRGDVEVLAAVDGDIARMMITAATDGQRGFRLWPEVRQRDVEVLAAVDGDIARMMMTAATDGRRGFRLWPEVRQRW
nr:hypothetical protein [Tanacetum cinerariifolium]